VTALALGLVVVAAALHASWNLLAKSAGDKLSFIWWTGVAGSLLLAPVAILSSPWPAWTVECWVRIALAAGLRAAYFVTLTAAYQRGDLSAVYPLARGSSPVIVAIAASVLLAERPAWQAIAGIAAVAAGVYAMHLPGLGMGTVAKPLLALHRGAAGLALLTGALTAAYSVLDRANMTVGLDPVWYAYLTIPVAALLLTPLAVCRPGWREEWDRRRRSILGVGLLMPASYLLVLHALQVVAVSYVAPVREVGIVFAVVLGILVLGERHGAQRLVGAVLILLGVGLIATAPPA
jgi:drug/metabolite transporter (DMT)-like permease